MGMRWEDAYDNYRSGKGYRSVGENLLHAALQPLSIKVTLFRFQLKWI